MPKKRMITKKQATNRPLAAKSRLKKSAFYAIFTLAATLGVFAVSNSFAAGNDPDIVKTAKSYVGLKEGGTGCSAGQTNCGGKLNNQVALINKINHNTNLPWGASFISYVYRQAGDPIGRNESKDPASTTGLIKGIQAAGGAYYKNNSTNLSKNKPQPGDVINIDDNLPAIVKSVKCDSKGKNCKASVIVGDVAGAVKEGTIDLDKNGKANTHVKGWAGKHGSSKTTKNTKNAKPGLIPGSQADKDKPGLIPGSGPDKKAKTGTASGSLPQVKKSSGSSNGLPKCTSAMLANATADHPANCIL